jgi:serine/threonine-protein kinase
MHAHLTTAPPTPAELVPGLSREISNVVMKALAKTPEERFASAEAFQGALRDALFGADLPATATVALQSSAPLIRDTELAQVEARLATAIGPIARNLVAKAARQHSTVSALCAQLAEQIPDPAERATFLSSFGLGSGLKPAVTPTSSSRETVRLTAEELERARKALAEYMGPMAGVMVKQTARRVRSFEELREALAGKIPDERSRKDFLKGLQQ